jgi:hypothetical protein
VSDVRFGSLADISWRQSHVRFVPEADIGNLFNHLVGRLMRPVGQVSDAELRLLNYLIISAIMFCAVTTTI